MDLGEILNMQPGPERDRALAENISEAYAEAELEQCLGDAEGGAA